MNFKDRGNKKWNSLMLVEHQKLLKKLKEDDKKQKKPELDQQQLNLINSKIKKAFNEKITIKIIFFANYQINSLKGKINKIEKNEKQILIKTAKGDIKELNFRQIIEVKI